MSEDGYDIGDPEQRRKVAEAVVEDWREKGGVLRPGITYIRLEPGECVLSGEDVRRLLEGPSDEGES